eukprot:Filipodium_phascolosomae@DN1029_c0_g1_i1.p1
MSLMLPPTAGINVNQADVSEVGSNGSSKLRAGRAPMPASMLPVALSTLGMPMPLNASQTKVLREAASAYPYNTVVAGIGQSPEAINSLMPPAITPAVESTNLQGLQKQQTAPLNPRPQPSAPATVPAPAPTQQTSHSSRINHLGSISGYGRQSKPPSPTRQSGNSFLKMSKDKGKAQIQGFGTHRKNRIQFMNRANNGVTGEVPTVVPNTTAPSSDALPQTTAPCVVPQTAATSAPTLASPALAPPEPLLATSKAPASSPPALASPKSNGAMVAAVLPSVSALKASVESGGSATKLVASRIEQAAAGEGDDWEDVLFDEEEAKSSGSLYGPEDSPDNTTAAGAAIAPDIANESAASAGDPQSNNEKELLEDESDLEDDAALCDSEQIEPVAFSKCYALFESVEEHKDSRSTKGQYVSGANNGTGYNANDTYSSRWSLSFKHGILQLGGQEVLFRNLQGYVNF